MERKLGRRLACFAAALLMIAGCQLSMAEEGPYGAIGGIGESGKVAEEVMQKIQEDKAAELAADQPQVRTLENGVKVQRTPVTQDNNGHGYLYDTMGMNMKFLDADRRGCAACHADLADVVDNMDGYHHQILSTPLELEINVGHCVFCHSPGSGGYRPNITVGNMMHALHGSGSKAFEAVGGDCWSCHYAQAGTNEMQLWDEVKHDVLVGISAVSAEQMQAETSFSWDQTTVLSYEDYTKPIFNVNWTYNVGSSYRYAAAMVDAEPDPKTDGVYDQWMIEVGGEVTNPFTMSLTEMMEKFGVETTTMKHHCAINQTGAPFIGNYEITGIPLNKIFEYAGASEEMSTIMAYGYDGIALPARWSMVKDYGGYLVTEIDGKPIPYYMGYPVQVWIPGEGAWSSIKEVSKLEAYNSPEMNFISSAVGGPHIDCNVGLAHFSEGQIIEAGKPFTFEGFADSWDDAITSVEFSFDRGQTWMTCETPDAQIKDWVYWRLTWNNPQPGAYTIMVRAAADNGAVTAKPLDYLVNVQ